MGDDLYHTCTTSMGPSKMLITSKLKESPRPNFGLMLPLLGAIILPSLIRFRSAVMEKQNQIVLILICTCSGDDLYHTYVSGLVAPHSKVL